MRQDSSSTKAKDGGYLLLEVLVAVGVFTTVMAIGMGALLTMYNTAKKGQALKAAVNNLNFALETMSREITLAAIRKPDEGGSSLRCVNDLEEGNPPGQQEQAQPHDCPSGDIVLTFCSSSLENLDISKSRIAYRFYSAGSFGSLQRAIRQPAGGEGNCPPFNQDHPASWQPLTSPEVRITKGKFYVSGAQSPNLQPRVMIVIQGEAGRGGAETKFQVQTTLSQREPDLSILFQD